MCYHRSSSAKQIAADATLLVRLLLQVSTGKYVRTLCGQSDRHYNQDPGVSVMQVSWGLVLCAAAEVGGALSDM
jgi:hypothetical protein